MNKSMNQKRVSSLYMNWVLHEYRNTLSHSAEEDDVVAAADCNDINEQNRDINPS